MTTALRSFNAIAKEVKTLHDRDEALSKERAKNKIEQRDVRLKIGRLVTEVEPHLHADLAARSGYTAARLRDFVSCAAAWPEGSFPADANFTALEELSRDPDRFSKIKGGMTKRDAREAHGNKSDTPSRWSPQQKAAFVAEAVSDPAVARHVAQDRTTRAAMAEADWEAHRGHRDGKETASPGRKQQRELTEKAELFRTLDNIRYAIGKAVSRAIDLGLGGDSEVAELSAEVLVAATWLHDYATNGSTDFDSALTRLLEENS